MQSMQLFTLKTAASMLAVTRKTLYALHSKGQLEFVKVGKATRIAKGELERFISENSTGAQARIDDINRAFEMAAQEMDRA